jgi:hypothetical protein
MSGDLVALVAGTVLAVGALAFVLFPLFFPAAASGAPQPDVAPGASEDSAIVALREIEFDRATGKLSESDYAELKASYSARALAELRQKDGAASAEPDVLDPIEARVRAYRRAHKECPTCGLRPEADAVYCSACGVYLDRSCPSCRAPIGESSAAFCSSCGAGLARPRAIA